MIQINISNKFAYTLIILLVILTATLIVHAYQSEGPPSVMGHSAEEIEVKVDGEIKTLENVINNFAENIEVTTIEGDVINLQETITNIEQEINIVDERTQRMIFELDYTYDSSKPADLGACQNVDLEDYCGDEDGCMIRAIMYLKENPIDLTLMWDWDIAMENPTELGGGAYEGMWGWTVYEPGSAAGWISGNQNHYSTILAYGGSFASYNYEPWFCPNKDASSTPHTDPYLFTFYSVFTTKTKVIVYD